MKIAIIGVRNHAARLADIVSQCGKAQVAVIYHPQATPPLCSDFQAVLKCDGVFIASPSFTHAEYLRRLADYKGYVLVEKPVVTKLTHQEELARWSQERKERTYVNYNLVHSPLFNLLKELVSDPRLGTPLWLDISTSHGLAYKPEYEKDWRSDLTLSLGVVETVGVHYVHLALSLFGTIRSSQCWLRAVAREKGASDVATLHLVCEDNVQIGLKHSYVGPLIYRMVLGGTNGYWEYDGERATLYSPRNCVGENHRFVRPPIAGRWEIPQSSSNHQSMVTSVNYFLDTTQRGARFPESQFELALQAMHPLWSAQWIR